MEAEALGREPKSMRRRTKIACHEVTFAIERRAEVAPFIYHS